MTSTKITSVLKDENLVVISRLSMKWSTLFRVKTVFPDQVDSLSLKRVFGVRDLTFFGIAAIIGGGIFSSVGKACFDGGPAVVYLFILCGIACAFAAMCYAEFASRIPISGSAYTYAYASFGELFAWIIGWALIMEYAIGNIYVAFAWSGYVVHLLDQFVYVLPRWLVTDWSSAHDAFKHANSTTVNFDSLMAYKLSPRLAGFHIVFDAPALIINLLITMLVYRGVKESRNATNAMVILKLIVIVLVIVVGVFYVDISNYKPFLPRGFGGVMAGISAVFFTYIGFDAVSTMAEESHNPQRDLPKGMFYSLLICTILYVLIAIVLTGMVPYTALGVIDPLAYAMAEKGILWMELLVSVVAVIAMASVLLIFQMGQPRIWLSMARDGLLPPAFAKVHPKYKTPSFATIVTGILVGLPILFTNENFVLDFTSIGTLFAFVLVCGGVLMLKPRKENDRKGFLMPFVNAQYLFPLLIIASIVTVQLTLPNYFFELLTPANWNKIFWFSNGVYWLFLLTMASLSFFRQWSLIPLVGVSICAYLLTGMKSNNWYWFLGWLALGLCVYFLYGYRKSKLAISQCFAEEIELRKDVAKIRKNEDIL